jgi:hypothetical protein
MCVCVNSSLPLPKFNRGAPDALTKAEGASTFSWTEPSRRSSYQDAVISGLRVGAAGEQAKVFL